MNNCVKTTLTFAIMKIINSVINIDAFKNVDYKEIEQAVIVKLRSLSQEEIRLGAATICVIVFGLIVLFGSGTNSGDSPRSEKVNAMYSIFTERNRRIRDICRKFNVTQSKGDKKSWFCKLLSTLSYIMSFDLQFILQTENHTWSI